MTIMRILVCTSEYPPYYSSGIGNVAYNVVEQLKKQGAKCIVCSPNGDIKLGSSKMIDKFGIIGLLYYWHSVSKYFKDNDFDVAWLHNPLFLRKNTFQRSVVTIHSTYYGKMIQGLSPKIYNNISSKIERYCLNKLDGKVRFTAVSNRDCEDVRKAGIIHNAKYVPNGVDTSHFKPSNNKKTLRKKLGLPENNIIILSVGRLVEHKQPQKLIDMFSIIEKKIDQLTFVIAGKGELFEPMKEYVAKKNIKNIKFLDFIPDDDLPDLYACSDYFIIASTYEGGEPTLTVAEALASGLPCIVSDIPNLQFVGDLNCGIIVNFDETEKAEAKVIEYLQQDNSRHSKKAREIAVNNFDWVGIADKYVQEFRRRIEV